MGTWWSRLMVVALTAVMAGASPLCAAASQVKATRGDAATNAPPKAHACCGTHTPAGHDHPPIPQQQCTSCDQAFWSAPGAAGKWDGKLTAIAWAALPPVALPVAAVPTGEIAWGRPPDTGVPLRLVDLFHSACLLTI